MFITVGRVLDCRAVVEQAKERVEETLGQKPKKITLEDTFPTETPDLLLIVRDSLFIPESFPITTSASALYFLFSSLLFFSP